MACVHYRERWFVDDERSEDGLVLLYQSICLQNTPPVTLEEQEKCMQPRRVCWRLDEAHRASRRKQAGATAGAQVAGSEPGE